ncbi:hypothetical protein SADUNF_Sadunf01G0047400 [Salix dunnii]|uniref:Uncharacterized protein n=1 Tax=Salix dunnii TaxID=1413687 RepID=A0A835TJ75_9ROSI|nr:hypothetical protein SADUNF_Sadunf01G0047400 [Salix dunnii]
MLVVVDVGMALLHSPLIFRLLHRDEMVIKGFHLHILPKFFRRRPLRQGLHRPLRQGLHLPLLQGLHRPRRQGLHLLHLVIKAISMKALYPNLLLHPLTYNMSIMITRTVVVAVHS